MSSSGVKNKLSPVKNPLGIKGGDGFGFNTNNSGGPGPTQTIIKPILSKEEKNFLNILADSFLKNLIK